MSCGHQPSQASGHCWKTRSGNQSTIRNRECHEEMALGRAYSTSKPREHMLCFTVPVIPRVARLEVQHKVELSYFSLVIKYSFFSNFSYSISFWEIYIKEAILSQQCSSTGTHGVCGDSSSTRVSTFPCLCPSCTEGWHLLPLTNINISAQEPPTSFDACNMENSLPWSKLKPLSHFTQASEART